MARRIWAEIFRLLALWKKNLIYFPWPSASTPQWTSRTEWITFCRRPPPPFCGSPLSTCKCFFFLFFFYTYKHLFPAAPALFFPFIVVVNYKRGNNKRAAVVIMVGRDDLSLGKNSQILNKAVVRGLWLAERRWSQARRRVGSDLDGCGCGEGRRWNRKFFKRELIGRVAKSIQFGSEKTNYWSRSVFIRAPRRWN